MICLMKQTTFIQNCIYTNFRINWTQFYISFSKKGHQINVLHVSFNAFDSQFSSYTPFHFSLTVPLKLGRFYLRGARFRQDLSRIEQNLGLRVGSSVAIKILQIRQKDFVTLQLLKFLFYANVRAGQRN